MSETDHERWKNEVAAYVLGSLEPGESADLERHIAGCAECQEELRWLRPAVQLLPESVEQVEPSPELRERIVGQAHSEAGRPAPATAMPRRRSPFSSWRPVAALATLALLVAAVGGYAIRDGESGGGSGTEATKVVAGKPPGVTATMVAMGGSATLKLANVRGMPKDKVLEAWVRRDGTVEPVRALFVPDRRGRASTTIPDTRGVEVVMVTAEPPGGSDSPTSVPIVTLTMPE